MQYTLSDLLKNKYVICSCEGTAEKAILDLLIDNDKVCFCRENLIDGECTTSRKAQDIANEYLTREYELDIAILRIIDREKDNFKIPDWYLENHNVEVFDIVTKPEIEILHIFAHELYEDFKRACSQTKQTLKPSSFCKSTLPLKRSMARQIKTEETVKFLYSNDIERLLGAIKRYHSNVKHKTYCLIY